MKVKENIFAPLRVLLLLFPTLMLPWGCINEQADLSACGEQYTCAIRAVDNYAQPLSVKVSDVHIYVFGKTGFLRSYSAPGTLPTDYTFTYRKEELPLEVIALGNLRSDSVRIAGLTEGVSSANAFVYPLTDASGYDKPIPKLFRGYLSIKDGELPAPEYGSTTHTSVQSGIALTRAEEKNVLNMYFCVSGMSVTAKGLEERFGTGTYSYVVRGCWAGLSFESYDLKNDKGYAPALTGSAAGTLAAPLFFVTPATKGNLAIDICRGSEVVQTLSKDSSGNPFSLSIGEVLTITADFSAVFASVNVTVTNTPWTENGQTSEM